MGLKDTVQSAVTQQEAQQKAEKLTNELSEAEKHEKSYEKQSKEALIKEVINWQRRYSEVALVNNRHVAIINQLTYFITMQCGILYTGITGDLQVTDPLKEISPIQEATFDASQEDLNFFRKGLIIYLKKLFENGEIEEAYHEWEKYVKAEEEA